MEREYKSFLSLSCREDKKEFGSELFKCIYINQTVKADVCPLMEEELLDISIGCQLLDRIYNVYFLSMYIIHR